MKKWIIILIVVGLILGGVVIYMIWRKKHTPLSNADLKSRIMASSPGDTELEIKLGRMNTQELKDTYEVFRLTKTGQRPADPDLIRRYEATSKKFNIST